MSPSICEDIMMKDLRVFPSEILSTETSDFVNQMIDRVIATDAPIQMKI